MWFNFDKLFGDNCCTNCFKSNRTNATKNFKANLNKSKKKEKKWYGCE